MAHSKYGQDNIATITRQHGMRMNRVPRIAFSCLSAPFANELRLHDKPIRNAKTVWCALTDAVYFVVAGGSFSLKLKFKIFAMPFILLLELPLLAMAWHGLGGHPSAGRFVVGAVRFHHSTLMENLIPVA